jgi:hypothetical protein
VARQRPCTSFIQETPSAFVGIYLPEKEGEKMFGNRTIGVASLLLGFALVLSFARVPAGSAQDGFAYIRMIRAMEADETGLPDPAGLAFSNKANAFL